MATTDPKSRSASNEVVRVRPTPPAINRQSTNGAPSAKTTSEQPVQPMPASTPHMPKPNKEIKQKKPQTELNSNVITAIIATIIIVLGLAALAVYAYTKTQK